MLLVILTLLGYLSFQIISPFLVPIAWAIVFSVVFYPIYAFISKYIKVKSIASSITVLIILVAIIVPITYMSFLLIGELEKFGDYTSSGGLEFVRDLFEKMKASPHFERLSSLMGEGNMPTSDQVLDNIKKIGGLLAEYLSIRITNIISAAINFLFMIFTIFFLFIDGPGFLTKVKDYMPFNEEQKTRLATQMKDMIVSTVYGGVIVAIIQGILGGFGFYVIGIDSPVIWGIAMSVMSFVPLLGTLSIWGPASIYLLSQGDYLHGIGLILFGTFVISMVDNILKPLIIGSRTKMPTIVIFFSVLGGIKAFGIIGLIMGPLIMAVFVSVFEIFRHIEDEASLNRAHSEKNEFL
jgi:predicted PurR-regulated permease PerM